MSSNNSPVYARKNLVKEKLRNGQAVLGMEVWLRDPRVIELMGSAGFDLAHIENEHVAHNWEEIENLVRAAELAGLTPLYRTEQCFEGEPPVNEIIKALKCGAQIIMVPHVETAETARKIVSAVKFAPLGERGIATCDRSAKEIPPSNSLDIRRYIDEANEETMIWTIIESPRGLENVDEILDVDGIDAVGFGHQDYAAVAGLTDDSGAESTAARDKIWEAARRKGKLMWWNTDDPADVVVQRQRAQNLFLLSVDLIHLNNLFRTMITEARQA
jgi:4-hydroxy-2-oxoheptanedioate aldolase